MADTYFAKLSDAEDLPPAFDGIASSLDEFFANLALHGVDITFGDPDYPPNPDPNPGPPPFPEDEELDFSDTHEDPPAPELAAPTGQAPGPQENTQRLVTLQLEALSELEVGLPAFDGVTFVLNRDPFEARLSLEPSGFLIEATVGLAVRFDSELLVPMVDTGGGNFEVDPAAKHVDIEVASVTVRITEDGVDLDLGAGLVLTRPAMIGQTGVIVESADLSFNFDGTGDHPDGVATGWKGVLFNDASIRIPTAFSGAIVATKLGFGSGGVSGTIARTFPVSLADTVLGLQGGVTEVAVGLRENILTSGAISARVVLPFFDPSTPLEILISIATDGTLTATLKGSLATLNLAGVAQFGVTRVTFGVEKGVAVASLGGLLTPTAGELDWPSFEIEDLRVDAHGNVSFAGGWIDLDKQLCLNLYGFQLEITKIGLGKNDAGENWIGFNGAIKLLEGVPAGASVEGLRILWGGSAGVHVTLEGVGVELEIPGVLKIAGKVSLSSEKPKEFKGAVRVELTSLSVEVDGQFVAGTGEDPVTHQTFKTYAVYLQMQLPTGIALGNTGLAFYGFGGLYAHNREPDKHADEGWYRNPDLSDGWYTRDPEGITDVAMKWRGARGRTGFGAGIILGTYPDNGYLFNGRLLLALVFPGPVILIEGMANLLKKRTSLGEGEPNFHALVVIDPGKSFTAGLDAQYKFGSDGELLAIRGSAQTYFDFVDPGNWYINIGVDTPPENRIRARAFKLFDLNAYFMLNPDRLAIGGGWSYRQRWGFKHLYVGLSASLETAATISWHPAHFNGSISVAGGAELHAFFVDLRVSVGTTITGDVFDPFALAGDFYVKVNLPWPLPDVGATVRMEWKDENTQPPPLPVPLREGSIEHLKSCNTWPLRRGKSLFGDAKETGDYEFERPGNDPPGSPDTLSPPFSAGGPIPTIPADSKAAITFTRPIDDPNKIALQQVTIEPDKIGDRVKNLVTYTVGYGLKALALQKWAPGGESTDGSAAWTTVLEGGAKNADGTPQLSVVWQPASVDPSSGQSQQNKMLVNAVTPFDYTAERSKSWQEWFTSANAEFPCPLAMPELSARFTDPVGTSIPSKSVDFTVPAFKVSWMYGGDIGENDVVIPTVLGPLDRGVVASMSSTTPPQDSDDVMMTIVPPDGKDDVLVRLGSPKVVFRGRSSFSSSDVGEALNPLTLASGVILTTFDGTRAGAALRGANRIVVLGDGAAGLELAGRVEIATPKQPMYIELDVEVKTTGRTEYEAFGVGTDGVEGPRSTLMAGRNTLRFRGSDTVPLATVVVRRSSTILNPFAAPSAYLRRISWRPPLTARAFRYIGAPIDFVEPLDGLFHIDLPQLTSIQILGKPTDGVTLLEMALPADNQELVAHAMSSLSVLTKEDPLFEADTDYRLVVTTQRDASGSGGGPLTSSNTFTHHAYFHVAGPPGIGVPDQPPDQPAASRTGDTGLNDLRLYVEQTLPNTIPGPEGKLLLPKAFYRGYDVAVKFNEAYTELLYLLARRTLTTRLFDVNDKPITTSDGRVFIPVPSWERSRQQSLKESVVQWVGMVNAAQCRPDELPPFDTSTVVKNQVLSAPSEELILAPETLYQTRLVPSLLHETFVGALPGLIADGGGHRLERWSAESSGSTAPRWEIQVEPISGVPGASVCFVQESTGNASSLVFVGPLGAREGSDLPTHWSDFRAAVLLRWGSGVVGLELRRATGNDMIRLTLDRGTGARRLVALSSGTETPLADDVTTFPDADTDVLVTVDCIGDRVQVFQDAGTTPIFDVSGAPTAPGTLALRAEGAANARFTEIRVEDLRQGPSAAFTFDFVTSKYTNFHHHLHSYSDQLFDGAPGTSLTTADLAAHVAVSVALSVAGDGLGAVADAERRAFEALETKALGTAALLAPERLEVVRVSASGEPVALLIRSPEPLLWERTTLQVSVSGDATPLAVPGDVKLSDVSFGTTAAEESVCILVRSKTDLAGCRLEWRPLSAAAGSAWATYVELGAGPLSLDDGVQVRVFAIAAVNAPAREPGTIQRFVALDAASETVHFTSPGVELRLLGADGTTVIHQRRFLTSDAYSPFPMRALRKLDGTAVLLFPDPLVAGSGVAAMRLHWKFSRVLGDEDLRFRQSGSEAPEQAALDLVLPPAI